jgi:hypothetical protein
MRDLTNELDGMGNVETHRWDFTKNSVLTGRLVSYQEMTGKFGPFTIVEIRTETGMVDSILKHIVLKNALIENNVEPGDNVGIKCLGKHPQKDCHNYNVVVDKAG